MVISRDYKSNEDCTSENVHSDLFIHVTSFTKAGFYIEI